MLTVEVKGIGFANKGAELMLYAVIDAFEQRGIPARFVAEPVGDYSRRCAFGLWQKTRYVRKQINWLRPFNLLPSPFRNMLGLVRERDIDVVLDASGFSYGDQWNNAVARDRLASTIRTFNKRNVPVVVLPQALGPFTKAANRDTFTHIVKHADLLFPRDSHSFQYASELVPKESRGHIKQCPDFTNLIKGIESADFDPEQHQVCFIPNSKMVEKRDDGAQYLDFLVASIEAAISKNSKPFILIHEQDADRRLTQQILARLSQPVPVLDPQHALKIKWIIGRSKIVISSRFHGLVSALSQGVPVIATGWSHKYQELLNDYDCPQQLFDVSQDQAAAVDALVHLIEDAGHRQDLVKRIEAAGVWQREAATAMWDSVFALIQERVGTS